MADVKAWQKMLDCLLQNEVSDYDKQRILNKFMENVFIHDPKLFEEVAIELLDSCVISGELAEKNNDYSELRKQNEIMSFLEDELDFIEDDTLLGCDEWDEHEYDYWHDRIDNKNYESLDHPLFS